MRVWVSRAEPEAQATAERLRRRGHEPLVAPVLDIQGLPCEVDLEGVAALAFTSRNGVREFPAAAEASALPVFAVADATADAARAAGFGDVRTGPGDGAALARMIVEQFDPASGVLLVARADEPAFDLEGALTAAGIEVRTAIVYESIPIVPETEVRRWLADDPPMEAVLVHSRRAASQVARLLTEKRGRDRVTACCISESAAKPLRTIGLKAVLAAAFPNEASLLKLLGDPPEAAQEGP